MPDNTVKPPLITTLIAEGMANHPDRDVLTFEYRGETEVRTCKELWDNGQRLAAKLSELGMSRSDRFALLLHNHPEFVEAMIASAILGTVFVPIDPRIRGAKLAHMLRDSAVRGAVCADYSLDGLIDAHEQGCTVEWALLLGEPLKKQAPFPVESLADAMARPVPSPELPVAVDDPAEPMQIMYTSGTTGDPKGIVVPHARFGTVAGHGEAVFGYRPGDRPYTGLSLTHGNAQFATLAPSLKMGLRAVISRRFTKSRLWDIVREHGCTTFSLLGGMVTAIYSEPRRPDDADNPVRLVISAGMPAAIWKDFEHRFDVDVFEFYGTMEGGMTIKPVGEGPIGSCGRVAPGLVAKVVNDDGNELPPDTSGELWFRLEDGPFPPVTYLNNPQASADKVVDGWLRSGDIVYMNEDGWVFYEYRKGGGIRRNGEFINPAFVEKALAEHPSVDDIYVYGVPAANKAPGEKDVVAAVVPRDEMEPQELFRWARARLESNFVPAFIQIVNEIPKTASEKPQERFLHDMFRNRPETVHKPEGV